jgi:uncharacterized membrane protein YecN with MAPEG domain
MFGLPMVQLLELFGGELWPLHGLGIVMMCWCFDEKYEIEI